MRCHLNELKKNKSRNSNQERKQKEMKMIIITMIIKLLFHWCSFGIIIILINLCVAADQYSNQYQQTTTNPTLTIECRQQQSNCTDNIYPYLNDPQYMFPTSLEHVNEMCKLVYILYI